MAGLDSEGDGGIRSEIDRKRRFDLLLPRGPRPRLVAAAEDDYKAPAGEELRAEVLAKSSLWPEATAIKKKNGGAWVG